MDINFPLILTLLTLGTGLVWLFDVLVLKPRRSKEPDEETGEAPKEPYLVDLCRSFFPVLAVVLVLRSFLVEPFQIPSGSMLPTLQVGDFILVNKFTYGLRLPVLRTKILSLNEPHRGDVMVFRHYQVNADAAAKAGVDSCTYNPAHLKPGQKRLPGHWEDYIKRVVGLPGDKIGYHDKTLYINGKPVAKQFVADLPPRSWSGGWPIELFKEDLGGVEHDIYQFKGFDGAKQGDWVVPPHSYFMMGDDRDDSCDSRYWGVVPDKLIVGKAFAIWMHWKSFTELPSFSRDGAIKGSAN